MLDKLYNDSLYKSLSKKNLKDIKTLPISSNYLFDYLNDYENNYPEKYNKCFHNHNIPEEHYIDSNYLVNNDN